jgi:sterol desaturase/sphingolipid hydroxylase (fatty acid hydroxylase superfamily)
MSLVVAALLGVLTWTFLEYVIHRFGGHDARFRPNPFAAEHVRHHGQGDYFAPTWKKVLAALSLGALLAPALSWLVGPALGLSYVAGLLGFYGVYEVLHRREHTHAGVGAYGRWARLHHFAHHYSDAACNHGVTTPLWDFVFGTYKPVKQVRVPRRFLMSWLRDPATGGVRPELADRYAVGS